MFALRTRHMCYNSTCLTHIAPRRTQYCTITSKTRERIRSKSSPNRGVHTSAHRFVDREPKVNFETAEHVSDIGTPGNQDSVHSDTSWTNFGSGTRGSSTPVTGSGHEQDVSKSSTRTGIDQLRRYLGRPQTTIHPSELDNSEVQIAFDPDYDVVDSATYDADGYTVHIPASPPLLSLKRLPYVLDSEGLPPPRARVRNTTWTPSTVVADVTASPNQLGNLLKFCEGSIKHNCFMFSLKSNSLVMYGKSPHVWSTAEEARAADLCDADGRKNDIGRAFEQSFTTTAPGVTPGSEHVQLIRYTFGKLSLALRCDIDAFDESRSRIPNRLKLPGKPSVFPSTGQPIRSSDILELKCLNAKNWAGRFRKDSSSLWFARRKKVLIGINDGAGVIRDLKTIDMSERLVRWKLRHEVGLQKLHSLLDRLRVEATKSESGFCWALRNGGASDDTGLKIFALDSSKEWLYENNKSLDQIEPDLGPGTGASAGAQKV